MNKFFIALVTSLLIITSQAQEKKYSTYYYQRATLFEILPTDTTDIIFLGNSIADGGEWMELMGDSRCKNRGISGDTTEGVYDRLEIIIKGRPAKVFLLIGINDLGRGSTSDMVFDRIVKIIERLQSETPRTEIYLQSILPVNDATGMFLGHSGRWAEIQPLNCRLSAMAKEKGITFVDIYHHLVSPNEEKLDLRYSNDGLHLLGLGYLKWGEVIRPYID